MFYYLNGTITVLEPGLAVVDCGGVGYGCRITAYTAGQLKLNQNAKLYITESIREDAHDLYGFISREEQQCYELLTSVTGVGPKAALAVLSEMTPDKLAMAVASGDAKAVTKAQGVGPKIAQRIVLELKGKLTAVQTDATEEFDAVSAVNASDNTAEAVSALQFLGYSKYEAAKAVSAFDKNLSVEELIKKALAVLSKNL